MRVEGDFSILRERLIVLCDLVSGGLILVEVVFAVEAALVLNLAIEGYSGAQGGEEGFLLEVRLSTRKCDIK